MTTQDFDGKSKTIGGTRVESVKMMITDTSCYLIVMVSEEGFTDPWEYIINVTVKGLDWQPGNQRLARFFSTNDQKIITNRLRQLKSLRIIK